MDGLYWRCTICNNLVPTHYTTFTPTILEKRIKHYKKCANGLTRHDIIVPNNYNNNINLENNNNEDLALELLLGEEEDYNNNNNNNNDMNYNNNNNIDNESNVITNNNKTLKNKQSKIKRKPLIKNSFDIIMASTSGSPPSTLSNSQSNNNNKLNSHNSGVKHYVKKNAFTLLMNNEKEKAKQILTTNNTTATTTTNRKKKTSWGRRWYVYQISYNIYQKIRFLQYIKIDTTLLTYIIYPKNRTNNSRDPNSIPNYKLIKLGNGKQPIECLIVCYIYWIYDIC